MVQVLARVVEKDPNAASKSITQYYEILSSLLTRDDLSSQIRTKVLLAFAAPLVETGGIDNEQSLVHDAYLSIASTLLTTPDLMTRIGNTKFLAETVNIDILSQAILLDDSRAILREMNPESRLWLLAHFIYLHNLCVIQRQEQLYIRALSTILSLSANDIFGRIEISQPDVLDSSNEEDPEVPREALPEFIRIQVISLVNKQSITDLLATFDS